MASDKFKEGLPVEVLQREKQVSTDRTGHATANNPAHPPATIGTLPAVVAPSFPGTPK